MKNRNEKKWHEDILLGVLIVTVGVLPLFGGYSSLLAMISGGGTPDVSSKYGAAFRFIIEVESSLWRYLFSLLMTIVGGYAIFVGINKRKMM